MNSKIKRILAVLLAALTMVACFSGCKSDSKPVSGNSNSQSVQKASKECEKNGHKWTPATCDKAKTCSVCGATEGTALGHDWAEATCEKPKTCNRCGKTEGEALGHTVKIGTCSRCGKEVGTEIIADIDTHCNSLNDLIDVSSITSADTSALYSAIKAYENNYPQIRTECDKLVELFGNIPEFAQAKLDVQAVKDAIPAPLSSTSDDAIVDKLDDIVALLNKVQTFDSELSDALGNLT